MKRAAILIGVSKSGTLPELRATLPSVRAMEAWALDQRIDRKMVQVFTDENGPLDPAPIKTAIAALVDSGEVGQLIIYFSGHGINNRYNEFWLLSGAPEDPQAAVNVSGSMELARFSGIPHVVFFSDACRTAAVGIQAQYVSGSEVFPSRLPGGTELAVDVFWGTTLGNPAYETKDANDAATAYKAHFTEALVYALSGRRTDIVAPDEHGGLPPSGLVHPRPLKTFLRGDVTKRLLAAGIPMSVFQVPDARISSEPEAWVSRVPLPAAGEQSTDRVPESPPAPTTPTDVSTILLDKALNPDRRYIRDPLAEVRNAPIAQELFDRIRETGNPFGPDRYETQCGFKIRGAKCVDAYSSRFAPEILNEATDFDAQGVNFEPGQLVRMHTAQWPPPPGDNALLTFEGGHSVLLPVIPEYLATVTVADEGVTDVFYEPSANSNRWVTYESLKDELREIRSVVAASAYFGAFQPGDENIEAFARQMQVAKGLDPTLAIYAAYAYHEVNDRQRILQMADVLLADIGLVFFDVAMLARSLDGPTVVPFFPLLSQGWALLGAFDAMLPPALEGLEGHLRQSLWTTFDDGGASQVRSYMQREARK